MAKYQYLSVVLSTTYKSIETLENKIEETCNEASANGWILDKVSNADAFGPRLVLIFRKEIIR